jgi:hypothetical protein
MKKDYKLRSVNTKFWDDTYIISLDPIEKLIFLYFLTNPLTNLAGIYEIATKRIASDTGIDKDMIMKILERFERDGKVYYRNSYIILANYFEHQKYNKSMLINAENHLETLPDDVKSFIETLKRQPVYSLYTACAQEEVEVEGEIEGEGEGESTPLQPLFAIWRRVPDGGETMHTQNLIKQFGYEKVKNAFYTASGAGPTCKTIRYVRGILNSPDKQKTNSREQRKIGN